MTLFSKNENRPIIHALGRPSNFHRVLSICSKSEIHSSKESTCQTPHPIPPNHPQNRESRISPLA